MQRVLWQYLTCGCARALELSYFISPFCTIVARALFDRAHVFLGGKRWFVLLGRIRSADSLFVLIRTGVDYQVTSH